MLVRSLEREGVELLFAYPGSTSMLVHQCLLESPIRVILPRHEQGGGFEAEGYARASGRPGVCMATSGPGATNLVTAIADAWMDSVPLVAITCQVNQHLIGKNAFQETDIIGMTRPVVKHSLLVLHPEEIAQAVKDAFYLAASGRPGPVVIDIPTDVLRSGRASGRHAGGVAVAAAGIEAAVHLRRRRSDRRRGLGGIAAVCAVLPHPGGDQPDGHRRFSGKRRPLAEIPGHARVVRRQLRGA